jgi:hypothetical protein
MRARKEWTDSEDEICVKHFHKIGGAGIIAAGYITDRTASAINSHCRTMLGISCDQSAIKVRSHKVAKERGTFIHANESMRKRGKDKQKREALAPETHKGHKLFAGLSSIFAVGAA